MLLLLATGCMKAGAQGMQDSTAALSPIAYGVVNLSVSNNRLLPENRAELITQSLLGTPVQVLRKDRGYYLVRTPDKYVSWTEAASVQLMDSAALRQWLDADKIVFTDAYGHALQEPSLKALPVSDLVQGNILQLLGKKRKFYKVAFPDHRVAYVPVKSTMPYRQWIARPNPDAAAIVATAQTLIGVPYLWGGTSIKGMDCSGFTKTCYYLNGIVLPRDASQQAVVGNAVDITENDTVSVRKCLQNLQPGDLLFFGVKRGPSAQVHVIHTAIYMGDGLFIQAAGMVRINSLVPVAPNFDEREWKRLVSARRMLTAIGQPEVTRVGENAFYR